MKMRRLAICVLMVLALTCGSFSAAAVNSNVSYSGNAGQFVFEPGSDRSVTDLFADFKNVMPGDTCTQTIWVRNNASDAVDVKVYLRALGAHEQSQEFLSQLILVVSAEEGELFRAPANQTAQLGDWVALGTLSAGGEAELTVTLQVPVSLDNRFMNAVGFLDWQFMVEEFPVQQPEQPDNPNQPSQPDQPVDPDRPDEPEQPGEPEDPDQPGQPSKPDVPKTGDSVNVELIFGLFAGSGLMAAGLLWLLFRKKKPGEPTK